jgi:AcrR family transcriptional regulator
MKYEERKEFILRAALNVAEEVGYLKVTRDKIARKAKISSSLVQFYFRNMENLRKEIAIRAIKDKNIPVVAQLLGTLHYSVLSAPDCIRKKALTFLANAQAQKHNSI